MIPYTLFYQLLAAIANVAAAEQLQAYYAQLLAVGQVWSSDAGRSSIRSSVTALTALAYPSTAPDPEPPSKIVVVAR